MSRFIKKLFAAALLISMMGIASASMVDSSKGDEAAPQVPSFWLCPPVCW